MVNIKTANEIFYILFPYTKQSKSSVYFTSQHISIRMLSFHWKYSILTWITSNLWVETIHLPKLCQMYIKVFQLWNEELLNFGLSEIK